MDSTAVLLHACSFGAALVTSQTHRLHNKSPPTLATCSRKQVMMKAPAHAGAAERAQMCRLALALVTLSQGVPFVHAGDDLLRSKSLDRDSYNSGDHFNRVDWSGGDNNFGVVGDTVVTAYCNLLKRSGSLTLPAMWLAVNSSARQSPSRTHQRTPPPYTPTGPAAGLQEPAQLAAQAPAARRGRRLQAAARAHRCIGRALCRAAARALLVAAVPPAGARSHQPPDHFSQHGADPDPRCYCDSDHKCERGRGGGGRRYV